MFCRLLRWALMEECYTVGITEHGFPVLWDTHHMPVLVEDNSRFTFVRIPPGMQEHYTIQRNQTGTLVSDKETGNGWVVHFIGGARVPLAEFANTTTVIFMGTLAQNARNIMNL